MLIILDNPREHKLIIHLKQAKDELVINKSYFAIIFKQEDDSVLRKIHILDDKLKRAKITNRD